MPEQCLERSGFLFAHSCGHEVERNCAQCQKPVCRRHTATDATGRLLCTTCGKKAVQNQPVNAGGRNPYYHDPYFYSYYYYPSYQHHVWHHQGHAARPGPDVHDFTEGDQAALMGADDGGDFDGDDGDFESDMGGS